MNSWAFVLPAYGIALCLTAALLLWTFFAMRRAEAAADAISRK